MAVAFNVAVARIKKPAPRLARYVAEQNAYRGYPNCTLANARGSETSTPKPQAARSLTVAALIGSA